MPESESDSPLVFLVHACEDQALAVEAETALGRAGLRVRASWQVLNWETLPDLSWHEELAREVSGPEAVLLLISAISVTSESFALQIQFLVDLWPLARERGRV